MKKSEILDSLIYLLPKLNSLHSPHTELHSVLKTVARKELEALFAEKDDPNLTFHIGPFGDLVFPYINMGAVDSLNLFDLDELIIFSFYWTNRKKYRNVLDLGANIGLHSVILGKCGYNVRSYEPDPSHFKILENNLVLNDCLNVEAINAAISYEDGEKEFIRVCGNTTGSHIAGSKDDPYGELEKFSVEVRAIKPMLEWADLVKMDIEGHEKEVFNNTPIEAWKKVDVMLEIENEKSAKVIFNSFKGSNINLFSEMTGWSNVKQFTDMPKSYHDGSLFITHTPDMPWI